MIKTITDIAEYQFEPQLESNEASYNTPIILFGQEWRLMDDYWMKHLHIKITDRCDAHCPFCIEKNSHIKENRILLLHRLEQLLAEMKEQGHLTTVSITGGEPSLCDYAGDVVDTVKKYGAFLNINTNFHHLIKSKYDPDWLNISRHTIGYDNCTGIDKLNYERLRDYKAEHPATKIRLQCVLHPQGFKSVGEIKTYIDHYASIVDDISFRGLITTTDSSPEHHLIQSLKHYLYINAVLVEQVLKDYYVYETWNYFSLPITISHSNMKLLRKLEQTENDKILREIIIHPDGLISGSWYRDKKVIAPL